MPTRIVGTLDRLLANVLVARARGRWPLLSYVPSRWLRPVLMPTARRFRGSLARAALVTSLAAITAAAALLLARQQLGSVSTPGAHALHRLRSRVGRADRRVPAGRR